MDRLGPRRVLLAPSAYFPHVGGIEELTRQLALALRGRGHEVAVLSNLWPPTLRPYESLDGFDLTRLAFPLPASNPLAVGRFLGSAPRAALALLRHVRRWRPDVLHVIGAGPQAVYVAGLDSLLRVPLVFTAQGELTFDASGIFERSLMLRVGLRRMLTRADAVTACSSYVLATLDAFGEVRAGGAVIPNGVEPRDFAPASDSDADHEFGRYILGIGRLVPQKGFDVLVEAFADRGLEGLSLVVAGDGVERRALEARAGALGVASRVHFVGWTDRKGVARLLSHAHAFAFPSRGEAFGIALLEAMAAGVPAVAAAAGGIPEFARNDQNALLVPADDPPALARALVRLSKDHELRARLRSGGRRTASQLSWSSIARRYECVYFGASGLAA